MNAIHAHTVRAVLALAMGCFGNAYAQTLEAAPRLAIGVR
jgi:hypothetical protein